MIAVPFRERVAPDATPGTLDVVLAIALAIFAQFDLRFNLDNSSHFGSEFGTATVVAIATLALIWRRRWPLGTLAVVMIAVAAPQLWTVQTITLWGHFVPMLLAGYAVARWSDRTTAVVGALISLVGLVLIMVRVPSIGTVSNIPFSLVPLTAVFVAGRVLRTRAAHHRRLRERTEQLERQEAERQQELAAAISDERARIARELHDIVAHCVSVMVVLAGAAEDLLDRAPERARDPLRSVQETGQQAVAELGRMLGLLRGETPSDTALELAPQPGTGQLPELLRRMHGLGVTATIAVTGTRRDLPPGVDLAAYRIVQEALTNTVKHAGRGATAEVRLSYLPTGLEVEVIDDGRSAAATAGTGHGLIGMAERAAVYGGSIEAGTAARGGFRVLVRLPLEPA